MYLVFIHGCVLCLGFLVAPKSDYSVLCGVTALVCKISQKLNVWGTLSLCEGH